MSPTGTGNVQGTEGNSAVYNEAIREMEVRFGVDRSRIDEAGLSSTYEEITEGTDPGRELLMFVRSRRTTPANIVFGFESYLLALSYAEIGRQLQGEADSSVDPQEKQFLERAARHARSISLALEDGRYARTSVDTLIGIRNNLQNTESRGTGILLLNIAAAEYGLEDRASTAALENYIGILWEGFDAADWQGTLEAALQRMTGRYQFVRGTDLLFTTDIPFDANTPITSPRQWAPSIWHEIHDFTRLERGISIRSLLALLLNGDKKLSEFFRELIWRYQAAGEAGRAQRYAANHLMLVAASQDLDGVRRYIVETTLSIIDSEEFRNETEYRQTLREVADNITFLLSHPVVNPVIEQGVATLLMDLYARRSVPGRYFEIGNALSMLRPLMDLSWRGEAKAATSLGELALNYARKNPGGTSGTPSAAPEGEEGTAASSDSGDQLAPWDYSIEILLQAGRMEIKQDPYGEEIENPPNGDRNPDNYRIRRRGRHEGPGPRQGSIPRPNAPATPPRERQNASDEISAYHTAVVSGEEYEMQYIDDEMSSDVQNGYSFEIDAYNAAAGSFSPFWGAAVAVRASLEAFVYR